MLTLFEQRQLDAALAELQPILDFQPQTVELQELACELWARKSPSGPQTLARCRRAADMPEAGPVSFIHLSRAQLASSDADGAAESLGKALPLLEERQAAPFVWALFVEQALEVRQLSWAEAAAARVDAQEVADVAARTQRQRRWLGLPRDAAALGVPPEAEHRFLKLASEAQKRLKLDERKPAAAAVAALEKEYPRVPGTLALRCALEAASRRPAPARKACQAALAAMPDCLAARLTLSEVSAPAAAVSELEAVVSADPGYELAYRRLAELHRKARATAKLKELEAAYLVQFKKPLP